MKLGSCGPCQSWKLDIGYGEGLLGFHHPSKGSPEFPFEADTVGRRWTRVPVSILFFKQVGTVTTRFKHNLNLLFNGK